MAILTNAQSTFAQIGRREDLANVVYLIDPQETPFVSNIAKVTATNTLHEWQTQGLSAPSKTNFQLEGDAGFNVTAVTNRVRLNNVCAISRRDAAVTGSAIRSVVAGVSDDLDEQKMLKGVELKRDLEVILLDNNAKVTGAAGTARECAGLAAWITNTQNDYTKFSAATGDGTDAWNFSATTARSLSLTAMNAALLEAHIDGGRPNMLLLPPALKQKFSGITLQSSLGGAAQVRFNTSQAESMPLIGSADVWVSDFGTLQAFSDVQLASDSGTTNGLNNTVYMIDTRYAALASYRDMFTEDLAKTGDATPFMVVAEYTLEVRAPKAHAFLGAVSTS